MPYPANPLASNRLVVAALALSALFIVLANGCSHSQPEPAEAVRKPVATQAKKPTPAAPRAAGPAAVPPVATTPAVVAAPASPAQPRREQPAPVAEPRGIVPASRVSGAPSAGFRRIESQHLVLLTDLPPDPEIDLLPKIFDLAYPQWCDYFSQPQQPGKTWRMTAFLMGDRARFRAAGLLPDELPTFDHGFCAGAQLWLDEQPNAYYRRHLLLHEGTHGFMHTVLGGVGPVWYAEGMAELLGTHHWADGRLTLDWFPKSREEVPQLGRIKLVRDTVAAGRLRTLGQILATDPLNRFGNETYAWCWALASLLDRDARYQPRFRESRADVLRSDFNARLERRFAADWDQLNDQWEVFATTLVHDYDFQRAAIDFAPGEPLPDQGAKVSLRADRGWQSTKLRLEAGRKYTIRAAGRYQVAEKPRVWWCEPGGITMRYVDGHPLGILLAAIRPDRRSSQQPTPLVRPEVIGLAGTIAPAETGTLYLRINDSPAELAENAGQLEVEVTGK
jgi:hypothetical protein